MMTVMRPQTMLGLADIQLCTPLKTHFFLIKPKLCTHTDHKAIKGSADFAEKKKNGNSIWHSIKDINSTDQIQCMLKVIH